MSVGFDIVAVLPGAASLGAYQAGAMAGVVAGRHHLVAAGHDVRIPAIGGASAGATVALLAAHSLAHGLDPVAVLRAAWVERIDLDVLMDGTDAPLGYASLREGYRRLLLQDPDDFRASAGADPAAVDIHIALTNLRGYRYHLKHLGRSPTGAITYADWDQLRYEADGDPRSLCEPDGASALDLVMASLANPATFAPVLLDRAAAMDDYRERGLDEVTDGGASWWFTDGGLVQSRPIQRTLAMVAPSDRPVRCVVIDPRSEGPSTGTEWADAKRSPRWLAGLIRALSIFPAQVLSDELRQIDDTNQSLDTIERLAGMVRVADEKAWADLAADLGADPNDVRAVLAGAVGLGDRRAISADVIHPLLVAESEDVEDLLAGELLGDFAGFLGEELRASDFSLGYECAAAWWEQALGEHDLGHAWDGLERALAEHGPPAYEAVDRGSAQIRDMSWRSRARLGRLAARALRALVAR